MRPTTKTEHPHIVRKRGVCGGSPIIEGTRIPVRLIVGYVKEHIMTIEEIQAAYPDLTLAKIYDALSYYHDHKAQIDKELQQNTLEYIQKKYNLELTKEGILRPKSNRK